MQREIPRKGESPNLYKQENKQTVNDFQTSGTGTSKHVKSTLKNMVMFVSFQSNMYRICLGYKVRVVWKLFKQPSGRRPTEALPATHSAFIQYHNNTNINTNTTNSQ